VPHVGPDESAKAVNEIKCGIELAGIIRPAMESMRRVSRRTERTHCPRPSRDAAFIATAGADLWIAALWWIPPVRAGVHMSSG
jgi:hypothetical protein